MSNADSKGPRVAMVVANDVSSDTRVRKMAHDLAAAGLDVTVVGISPSRRHEEFSLGKATVERVPVGNRLRTRRRLLERFNKHHQIAHEISIRKARFFSYQREVGAAIAWLRSDYFASRTERNEAANQKARRRLAAEVKRRSQRQAIIEASRTTRSLPRRLGGWLIGITDLVATVCSRRAREWRKQRRARQETRLEAAFRRRERSLQRRLERRHRRFLRSQRRLEKRHAKAVETRDSPKWHRALPELDDLDATIGPRLDAMRPDIIHAQDVHLLEVAGQAVSRARGAGFDTKLIYDAHEYIQGLAPPRPVKAWSSLEARYIRRADAVITVAPAIASLLQADYDLTQPPTVIMNIPAVVKDAPESLRAVVGLSDSDLLLVYSGGLDASRGVHTLVAALEQLPDAHLALVSKASTEYTRELEEMASKGGYRDRVHFAPFVEPQQVVGYLSSADIGVHTIVSGPINHEVTLPNKVFEYMHARLPIVISNCRAMSELVSSLGVGEVFVSEDVDSLTEALERVISNLDHYRRVFELSPQILETYSWRSEREKLFDLYRNLLGFDALPPDLQFGELLSSRSPTAGQ